MGSKRPGEGAEKVYAAADLWVKRALRADDSLFTPGEPIWSSRWLEELCDRFLDRPDESQSSFDAKLHKQLVGSPPEVHQLMAEALYVHFLIVWQGAMGAPKKEDQIRQVLRWGNRQVSFPDHLVAALTPGLAHPGQAFFNFRPFQVGYLIEFARQWKLQTHQEQERLLENPWEFKQFLRFKPTSLLFEEFASGDGTYRAQREALLHLVFPHDFEAIVSVNNKSDIRESFATLVSEPTKDVDRELQQIRSQLEFKRGRTFNFYDDDIRAKWDSKLRKLWDEYVTQAEACVDTGLLDSWENDYKVEIGRDLAETRRGVLANADDWVERMAKSVPDNPLGWRSRQNLLNWVKESKAEALTALQAIWAQDPSSVDERIRNFSDLFPTAVASGTGVRMRYISVLLMGLDAYRYPPFQTTIFQKAYGRTGHGKRDKDADEAALYRHALSFLDLFMEEASERGLKLRHRLDAQSLVWMIEDPPPPPNEIEKTPPYFESLATKLHLPVAFLEEIETLLKEKRQVVFQGPPGTGKTYVAQKLAEHLAGSKDRVTLVQFHPSYAYEDFVQGYRPSLLEGQPGFELKDGPLLQAARRAEEDSGSDHYLVIDEINRGNLAKVFGELYFLLEYRNEAMRLQYQADREFSLPENLYIIGTMNTADRSIALVDLALRRRFYFVEFHPDDEPIKGLLRKWLQEKAPEVGWVADVIDLVNKKLEDDRHVAIGPSYFMGTDEEGSAVVKDETSVRRIWKHSVLPYIEEHLFGNLDGMDEWDLDKLMQQVKAKTQASVGEEGSTNTDASD